MNGKTVFWAFAILLMPLLLAGCSISEELTQWAVGKTNDALEEVTQRAAGKVNDALEVIGGGVQKAIDDLHNAEYQGGPFENDLDSARAYLLEQMQEKYGIEFTVVGNETLTNYGPFAGASYSCEVAPADTPEQVATAFVSQTMYQNVRDDYAVYFFKEKAEAPALALCESKDYVIDQRISLEMPETAYTWTADDGLDKFLAESGAYIEIVLRFEDYMEAEVYAKQMLDFLNSIGNLKCNILLQAKANKIYIFSQEINLLDGFDASAYTFEYLLTEIEEDMSMGAPQ